MTTWGRIAIAGSISIDLRIEVRVTTFSEPVVEETSLAWLESVGLEASNGAQITSGELSEVSVP